MASLLPSTASSAACVREHLPWILLNACRGEALPCVSCPKERSSSSPSPTCPSGQPRTTGDRSPMAVPGRPSFSGSQAAAARLLVPMPRRNSNREPSWPWMPTAAVVGLALTRAKPKPLPTTPFPAVRDLLWPPSPQPAPSLQQRHGRRTLFPASSESVRSVRIRSTTLARLLHGFVLLPSGISGKMIISLDTITITAKLVVSFLSLVSLPTTCLSSLPKCHEKPLTPPHPSKPLFGYVTACSSLLIALLVAGAIVSMSQHGCPLIYHNIIAI